MWIFVTSLPHVFHAGQGWNVISCFKFIFCLLDLLFRRLLKMIWLCYDESTVLFCPVVVDLLRQRTIYGSAAPCNIYWKTLICGSHYLSWCTCYCYMNDWSVANGLLCTGFSMYCIFFFPLYSPLMQHNFVSLHILGIKQNSSHKSCCLFSPFFCNWDLSFLPRVRIVAPVFESNVLFHTGLKYSYGNLQFCNPLWKLEVPHSSVGQSYQMEIYMIFPLLTLNYS